MAWFDTVTKADVPVAVAQEVRDRHRLTVEVIQGLIVGLDLLIAWGTAVASRLIWSDGLSDWTDAFDLMTPVGLVAGTLFVAFVGLRRAYSVAHLSDPGRQLKLVVQGWAFTFFVLGWGAFLAKASAEFSRGAVSIHFALGFCLVAAVHGLGAKWLGRRFAVGSLSLRRVSVIAVADDYGIERIRRRLAAKGVEVVSCTPISPGSLGKTSFLALCRAALTDERHALAKVKLDGIYIFVSWRDRRRIDELRSAFGPMPVPVYLFADRETEALIDRPQVRLGTLRGFEVQRAPLSRVDRMIKRAMDIAVAGTAIVVLSPLMLMTAAGILLETGRPILFRQNRRGFGARPFPILKFRSMTVQENGSVVTQATKGDARVTRLGRLLRKTSIDELPQLFNVLKGDMSIVGPRPHAVAHDDHYDKLIATYAFRQHVKPGITGWAQVSGHRGETREVGQMSARVEHDLWYINNWSPWLDLKIIVMTALKVLMDDGAY